LWTNPVQSFIDDNCIFFSGADEIAFALTTVHEKFRELVDSVLQSQLTEMGIPAEQFIGACQKGKNRELNTLVSEYILALDDFPTFKKMMEKRNVELELEAMRTLKFAGPESHRAEDAAANARNQEWEEMELVNMAIAASIREDEILAKQLEMEDAQLDHALAMSILLEEERLRQAEAEATEIAKVDAQKAEVVKKNAADEHKRNVSDLQKTFKDEKASKAEQIAAKSTVLPTSSTQTPTLGAVQLHRLSPFQTKAALPSIPISSVKTTTQPPPSTSAAKPVAPKPVPAVQPTAEEIEKRKQAMKTARDQLLVAKKSERQKELDEWEKQQAAKKETPEPVAKPVEMDEQQKEMRIALGRRFKEDLIQETRTAALRQQKENE
jgi:hypothetical protein